MAGCKEPLFLFLFLLYFCSNSYGLTKLMCSEASNGTFCVHTKLTVSDSCLDYREYLLSSAEKTYLTSIHSAVRENMTKGVYEKLPKAFFMKRIGWSEKLAKMAQNWAAQCKGWKDPNLRMGNQTFGQNVLVMEIGEAGKYPLSSLFSKWIEGVNYLTPQVISRYRKPGPDDFDYEPAVRIIWWNTTQIGCGRSIYRSGHCLDEKTKGCYKNKTVLQLVCNYFPMGAKEGEPVYVAVRDNNLLCQYGDQRVHCKDLNLPKERSNVNKEEVGNVDVRGNTSIEYRIRHRMMEFWPAVGSKASYWDLWFLNYFLLLFSVKILIFISAVLL